MLNRFKTTALATLLLGALLASSTALAVQPPSDQRALAGVQSGKALFDINLSDAQSLPVYLQVIKQTFAGLKGQQVEPDFIVAFRGPAVTLVTDKAPKEVAAQIAELSEMGVRFEACNVATTLFGIDNTSLLKPIEVVGNTFISAIGYSAKGYVPIPIQ